MRRLVLAAVIATTALPTLLWAASKCYDVSPYADCVGQLNTANCYVTQTLINTLDSLDTVSVWVGDTLSSQPYLVEIRDSAVPTQLIAHGPTYGVHAPQCWAWLKIPLTKGGNQGNQGQSPYLP